MLDNRLHFQFPSLARAPNGAAGRMDQSRYASYPRDYLCALTYCTASVSFSSFFFFFFLLSSTCWPAGNQSLPSLTAIPSGFFSSKTVAVFFHFPVRGWNVQNVQQHSRKKKKCKTDDVIFPLDADGRYTAGPLSPKKTLRELSKNTEE